MHGRYRGDLGMWMFLLHRLTGVGIFVFLLVHIVDTSLIGFSPKAYDHMVWLYHHPVFRVGEILLLGAVLLHALNGVRVIVMDFVPAWTVYNRQLIVGVVGAFVVLFVPSAAVMFSYMLQGSEPLSVGNLLEWRAWLPAAASTLAVAAVSVPSLTLPRPQPPARPVGGMEFLGWAFMRVSGILLIFLVLGHFAIMHLLDGGVNRINAAFVAQRWANVGWRFYDFAMLLLAMGHGVWGMRTVLLDFVHRPTRRFWALAALYTLSGAVMVLGALVLFTFQAPSR
ncbi:Succinate dehydrogenase 2 membrane subunit SdhC [bacterium HR17]|uniref:Succinate dehydrogenase 2 membrane subunit SdhC n=1 Tax=Candidatus Fervidibacter japonicus TaxID=2035412 RepID=A0A2H5XBR6_9BACT|nr:Succinate dehydrogenase 2 membrane subunit SdhC [bacterium HR17]